MTYQNITLARNLRKNPTDAERKLWQMLRRRQLNGYRFRRQVPLGKYILDFVCFDLRIVIEVDGSQHADTVEYDEQRTKYLASYGYRVLRFWNNQVLNEIENVIEEILKYLLLPYPNFPLAGEGTTSVGKA